ncbi:MAG: NYN domain-containing protein [Planctomycetes bacterium]|nr:NYN domain-containing protein [Planctomycetota bacterium]MCB9913412.1 NYN domain-containing protein [Planctomycetota bacterium]HPF14833.1 NYN domain-containing protein [Planctomycetota bacterium]HRV80733.1 NYN domain-containing protein [Planctomycetota bacterium]
MQSNERSSAKVGVFVDSNNIRMNGGYGMRYDVLREYAMRDGSELIRLNAYLSFDRQRAEEDEVYRRGQANYTDNLRDFGYKVAQKKVRRYDNGDASPVLKADLDVEITVDMLTQGRNLDRIILATGNGDFVQAVRALQEMGKRVEILGFDNVSGDLRREADQFTSGFLIPNLLPFRDREKGTEEEPWGEPGSRVRGVCYSHTGRGYGFLRYMRFISPRSWSTNTRSEDSPYGSAFVHDSAFPEGTDSRRLPSRSTIFEFDLVAGEEPSDTWQAQNVTVAST